MELFSKREFDIKYIVNLIWMRKRFTGESFSIIKEDSAWFYVENMNELGIRQFG